MKGSLAQFLVDRRLLSEDQWEQLQIAQRSERNPAQAAQNGLRSLLRAAKIGPRDLVRVLWSFAERSDYLLHDGYALDPALMARVPEDVAVKHGVVPIVQIPGVAAFFLSAGQAFERAQHELSALLNTVIVDVHDPQWTFAQRGKEWLLVVRQRARRPVGLGDVLSRAGAVALTPSGRRAIIATFERRLDQEITHPVFGYRVAYRRLFEVQARLLGRFLSGEIPDMPHITPR
jgi:hypothetical protein